MDSADSQGLCQAADGVERTHVFFGMQKFETISFPVNSYSPEKEQKTQEETKESQQDISSEGGASSKYRQLKTVRCVKATFLL
jgi:hypothetical protein